MMEEREDTVEEEEDVLIPSVLSTARALIEFQSNLEQEYKKEEVDFDTFYETEFKQKDLIETILDLYTAMRNQRRQAFQSPASDYLEFIEKNIGKKDAIEALQAAEKNWDHFMKELDDCMKAKWQEGEKEYVDVIDIGHVKVTDCENDKTVALRDILSTKYGRCALFVLIRYYGCPVCFAHVRALVDRAKEFETKCANIIIVCRGTKEGGAKWKQLTGVTFPVLADEQSEFVRSLHFGASIWDLCNMAVFHWRAKVRAVGDTEYRGYVEDKLHDFYQLGGDIIVDAKGKLISVYKSKSTTDRPSVDELLKFIPNFDQPALNNPSRKPSVAACQQLLTTAAVNNPRSKSLQYAWRKADEQQFKYCDYSSAKPQTESSTNVT
uniref:Alkyl hydroperoxide reductase subunit C/ Thiol specific antioxidant domain-containing protein n=1 Tax=Plectus sambesii TaxID=2011161 RepID=A0A914W0I8_9BILA